MLTWDPLGPRSFFRAWSTDMSRVSIPSICAITSPGRIPARYAGVPSMGAMTVSGFSRVGLEMTMPSPLKLPCCSSLMSWYSAALRKWV